MLAKDLLTAVLGAKETKVKSVRLGLTSVVAEVEPTRATPICSGCFEPASKVYDRKLGRCWRAQDITYKMQNQNKKCISKALVLLIINRLNAIY